MKTKIFLLAILFSTLAFAQTKTDSVIVKSKLIAQYEQQVKNLQDQLQARANELVRADVMSNRIDAMIAVLNEQIKTLTPDSTSTKKLKSKINKE